MLATVVRPFKSGYHSTYINDCCCTAVQMFVQIVEHLPQPLHGLLVWLQEHGLKVHRQPISGETHINLSIKNPFKYCQCKGSDSCQMILQLIRSYEERIHNHGTLKQIPQRLLGL